MQDGAWASVRWADGAIEIVDQTKLPDTFEIVRLESTDAVVDALARLAVRGAPAIAACGALGLIVGLDEASPLTIGEASGILGDLSARLEAARPTAVNLSLALREVRAAAARAASTAELRSLALDRALRLLEEDGDACRRIGEVGRAALAGARTLLTHCNTGRLATTGPGTALAIVYALAAAGTNVHVFACEARPLLQGARLTTWELMDAGIDVTLIADGAAAGLLASGRIDAVVVGADRITANGDTANKVGTYPLALAASRSRVPFFVAAPWSTFDGATRTGKDVVIEQRPADEVRSLRGQPIAPEGVRVWNPAFDVTPHDLISGFVTETGVVSPPFEAGIAAMRPRGRVT